MVINVFILVYVLRSNGKYQWFSTEIWQLIKRWVKFINFLLYRLLFFLKTCGISFCHPYKFITYNYCITNDTFDTLIIFRSICTKIPNIIFFAHMIFLSDFFTPININIPILIWTEFCTFKFGFRFAWYMSC